MQLCNLYVIQGYRSCSYAYLVYIYISYSSDVKECAFVFSAKQCCCLHCPTFCELHTVCTICMILNMWCYSFTSICSLFMKQLLIYLLLPSCLLSYNRHMFLFSLNFHNVLFDKKRKGLYHFFFYFN